MSKLLPDRWADADFFTADLIGASPKDDVHTMEHPLFTLAKNKDTTIRRYTHNGNELEIQPGLVGMPTIWDKDVVIFLVSQAIEGLNRGRTDANERVVHFRAADYFMATNRKGSGRDYETLRDALDRLSAQRIKTNIGTGEGKTRIRENFGIIERWKIIERSATDSQMIAIEVQYGQWLHAAIQGREVLTLNRDYFRLSSSIERRLYELARKHCGHQPTWTIGLDLLHKKSGSTALLRRFRAAIKDVAKDNSLPDYALTYDAEADQLTFTNRDPRTQFRQLAKTLKSTTQK